MKNSNTLDKKYYKALNSLTRFLRKNLYLIIFTISFFTIFSGITNWDFKYMDTDNYMRATRIYNFIQNPSFFEQLIHQSNYPFGEINHWTRPMDILWLLCTIPFLWLNNIKEAIFLGGILINPIIIITAVIALTYGLRRQFNIYLVLFGSLLMLSSTSVSNLRFHNPDHHSLMLLLGIYSYSLSLCWLKKRNDRYLRLLGFSLALATYTAIEGIILYALFLSFYIYIYIFKKIYLTPAKKISKYFAYAVTIFWLLNPPYQGYLYPDNGRLSILFVTLSWFIWLSFHIINNYKIHTAPLNIVRLFLASSSSVVLLLLIFGIQILQAPLDAELIKIWAKRISEMQNIINIPWDFTINLISLPLLSILINIYLLNNKPYSRILTLNLIIGIPLFLLTLYSRRFSHYTPIYSIIPYICLIDYLYKKTPYAKKEDTEFPSQIWILMIGLFLVQELLKIPYVINHANDKSYENYSTEVCTHFQNIGGVFAGDTFASPQYIWYCNISSIASPYHRNREGIIDNHNIIFGENDETITLLLLKHQTTLILLPTKTKDKFYPLTEDNKNKLYYRLIKQENLPHYVEEIPLQTNQLKLYKVKI